MSEGWIRVIAATAVAVLGLAGFNLAVWRRLKEARRQAAARAVPDDERAA